MPASSRRTQRLWHLAPPLMLLPFGLWWLIGCIYVPTAEHPDDPEQFDFRGTFRSHAPQIEIGRTTKSALLSILGTHLRMIYSDDPKLEVYDFQTDQGFWLSLCSATPVALNEACLAVLYDERNVITDWQLVEMPAGNVFVNLATKLKPNLRERFVRKTKPDVPSR